MQLEANKRVFVTTLFRGVNTQSHKKLWSEIVLKGTVLFLKLE